MALTPEQKTARAGKIGASFAPALMASDTDRMREEWLRLTEHPDYVEKDLDAIWSVQFGSWVEPFALDWHEMRTGQLLVRRGEWVPHPDLPWLGCTLDAYREEDAAVIDCKAPGAHRRLDDVLAYYAAQMVVQRACMRAQRAILLVVHGGAEPREFPISWSAEYEAEVYRRLAWFWDKVETLQPAVPLEACQVPVDAVRIVDMTGSNSWADQAAVWLTTRGPAKVFEQAAKGLKALIEDDVRQAHGHGIVATRNRAGQLLIKEGNPPHERHDDCSSPGAIVALRPAAD